MTNQVTYPKDILQNILTFKPELGLNINKAFNQIANERLAFIRRLSQEFNNCYYIPDLGFLFMFHDGEVTLEDSGLTKAQFVEYFNKKNRYIQQFRNYDDSDDSDDSDDEYEEFNTYSEIVEFCEEFGWSSM